MPHAQVSPKRSTDTRKKGSVLFRPAPKPLGWTPSPFVTACLGRIPRGSGNFAVDLGCGYGRHAWLLASSGYTVVALDLDRRALRAIPKQQTRKLGKASRGSIHPIVANANGALPLRERSLSLALAVHYSIHDNFLAIEDALMPGGFLIYETFGGGGMNWVELPRAGQLSSKLRRRFEIMIL